MAKAFDRLSALLSDQGTDLFDSSTSQQQSFEQSTKESGSVYNARFISILLESVGKLIEDLRECGEAKSAAANKWQSALAKNHEMQEQVTNLKANYRLIQQKYMEVFTERNELKEENIDLKYKLQAKATARAVAEAFLNQRAVSQSESSTIALKLPQPNDKHSADVLAARKMKARKDMRVLYWQFQLNRSNIISSS